MKSFLTCAFGILALGLWAMPVQAGEPQTIILTGGCQSCGHGGCGNGGCGHKSISAASCCDDDCCKPSLWQRLKDLCKKNDCCEPACEQPCDPCCEKKKLFNFSFKKKNDCCCDDYGAIHAAPAAPVKVEPKAEPEKIGLPMPK